MQLEHSRALLLAGHASGQTEQSLLEHILGVRVQLTVESQRPDLVATAALVLETLRRLPVAIALSPGCIRTADVGRLTSAVERVDPDLGITVADDPTANLRIHLGRSLPGADIVAMPERHGTHLAGSKVTLRDTAPASGLGVMTTAALVCGEAFKQVAQVMPSRAVDHRELSWCPVTLSDDPTAAPDLHETTLALAIVGLGAIGTAVVRTLAMLPVGGAMMLVDPERFGPENVGTYSLGGAAEARAKPWKVEMAANALPRFSSQGFAAPVEHVIETIDAGEAPWPRIVLSGLDSASARREVQRLWPDRLIDGATGDTMCGVHDVVAGSGGACLRCLFPVRTGGPSSLERLVAATGLAPELLRYGDQPLTQGHLEALPPGRRALLQGEIGKPICGIAAAVGLTALPADDYRPSVPFVSQQAACLMLGRLVACILGVERQANFVQYDALIGPQARTEEDRHVTPSCFCQQRPQIVEAVRTRRTATAL